MHFKKPLFLIILIIYSSGCGQIKWFQNPDDAVAMDQAAPDPQESRQVQIDPALRRNEIVVGMRMNDVRSVWGEPEEIENAGDSRSGNQRWTYFNGLSSRWSLRTARIIYFEGGEVVGWETGQSN